MERLSFDEDQRYNAVEASIHLARYAVAAPYCRGARVLDIACGEGYGARFLTSCGATEVVGVEVDAAAVERAAARFGDERVSFVCADAVRVDELFSEGSFDLVVSLETIEHLHAPERFLRGLRFVATASATLIVSCPNDHWYFPDPEQSNPYHLRKYRFDEFQSMSEAILGADCEWMIGGPVMGFGSIGVGSMASASHEPSQLRMNHYVPLDAAYAISARDGEGLEPGNSSYFVGIWGGVAPAQGSAVVYPMSMDGFEQAFYPADGKALTEVNQHLQSRVEALESGLAACNQRLAVIPGPIHSLFAKLRHLLGAMSR
jgi:SAM-dependent methyltransferase